MPVEKVDRTPKLRRRRGAAKRKSARQNVKNPVILPTCSRKPLPPVGPCPKVTCKEEDCSVHCKEPATTKGLHAFEHEIDLTWLGWAKGYRDGTFDVSCARCGEIGWIKYIPKTEDVDWG